MSQSDSEWDEIPASKIDGPATLNDEKTEITYPVQVVPEIQRNLLNEQHFYVTKWLGDVREKTSTEKTAEANKIKAEITARLPKPPTQFDETWTQEDETQLLREWQQDPSREPLLDSKPRQQVQDFCTLFKMMMWRLGTAPDFIINLNNDLAVERTSGQSTSPQWPGKFCEYMTELVCHPFFSRNESFFILCLQYTVKCDTNDKRKGTWPRNTEYKSLFTREFSTITSSIQDGTKTMLELHKLAVDRLPKTNFERQPQESILLEHIEKVALSPKAKSAIGLQGESITGPYMLTSRRLGLLKKALDGFGLDRRIGFLPGSDVCANMAKIARGNNRPITNENLRDFREPVLIEIRRQAAKAKKAKELQDAEDGSDSQKGATGNEQELQSLVAKLQQENQVLKAQRDSEPDAQESESAEWKSRSENLMREVEQARSEKQQADRNAEAASQKHQEETQKYTQEIDRLRSERDRLTAEKNTMQSEFTTSNEASESQVANLQKQLQAQHTSQADTQSTDEKSRLALAAMQARNDLLEANVKDLRVSLNMSQTSQAILEVILKDLRSDLKTSQERLALAEANTGEGPTGEGNTLA